MHITRCDFGYRMRPRSNRSEREKLPSSHISDIVYIGLQLRHIYMYVDSIKSQTRLESQRRVAS